MARIKMKLHLAPQTYDRTWPCRAITRNDASLLAPLLLDAYRGTIDDGGETLGDAHTEIHATLDGIYGKFKSSYSFLVEDQQRALGASIVTWWKAAPMLAFVMVHPAAKGSGMGTFLIKRSIDALHASGAHTLWLFVTDGNADAQHIYAKLGFEAVETIADEV